MREIRTSGLMSGEGKRGDAVLAQATAPFLDSTKHSSLGATGAGLLLLTDAGWMEGPLTGCAVSTLLYVVVSKLTFAWQPRVETALLA